MPTLQSTGIGSGLDVNSLVNQLVAAERAPTATRITRLQQSLATEISALGTFKGAIASFQSALDPLRSLDTFLPRTANSDDNTIFSPSVSTSAVAGTYEVEVTQIAKANQISSTAFASGSSQVVGTGTLTVAVGSSTMSLEINSTNNTVAGIRDAINKASNNPGVRASIVTTSAGAHLVLAGTNTGAANTIKVTQSGGDGNLAAITYEAGVNTSHYPVVTPAQSAIVEIAGLPTTSSTNTISGAIEGVTLTLKAEDPGTTHTLTVAYNPSAVIDKVKNFVTQFNSLATQIGKLRSYDPSTKAAGPLLGDALLNSVESSVRRNVANQVSGLTGDYRSLASVGIRTNADGTLTLDSAKLQKALDTDYSAVSRIFASDDGVAVRLYKQTTALLASDGQFATRNASLDKSVKQATEQLTVLDARMVVVQQRYLKQFSTLDSMLANMQTTSSFLTRQLASTVSS